MMKASLFSVIFCLVLLGCSSNQGKRIGLLEKELSIKLPDHYDVIQDDDITLSYVPSEYKLILTLEFEEIELKEIINQIEAVPYFNQLNQYKNDGQGIMLHGDEIHQYQIIMDSLSKESIRGTWMNSTKGYEFIDFFGAETMKPVEAWVDIGQRTLTFQYMKI